MLLLDSLLLPTSQELQSGHGTTPAPCNCMPASHRKGRPPRSQETKDTENLREAETAGEGQTLAFQSTGNVTRAVASEEPSSCHSAARDPGAGVEVCLYRDPGPVLHSEAFRDHRSQFGPIPLLRVRLGGWSSPSHRKCIIHYPHTFRRGLSQRDAVLLRASHPARQLPLQAGF